MTDMFDPEYNPYDQLQDIVKFCHAADKHIQRLVENQTKLIENIEELNKRLLEVEIDKLEKDLNETLASTRERRK